MHGISKCSIESRSGEERGECAVAWGSPDVALTVAPPAGMVILPVVPRSDLLGDTKQGAGLCGGIPIWLLVCLG